MGKKIVPLRPARKEGDLAAPKPLTLADIAVTWTEGKSTWETRHYVSGANLARAVLYLRHRHPHTSGHDPLNGDVGPLRPSGQGGRRKRPVSWLWGGGGSTASAPTPARPRGSAAASP